MKTVALRLEGPMQSWGISSRFSDRDTGDVPSKSGVVGLVGAALGVARDDDERIQALADCEMAVRIDRPGRLARDYQTAGGGSWRGGDYGVYKASGARPATLTSQRHYLADASFVVALGYRDAALADAVSRALRNPCWPLSLGRRGYVPSVPIHVGEPFDGPPLEALRRVPARPESRTSEERLRVIVETEAGQGAERMDVPVSLRSDARRFGARWVTDGDPIELVDLPEAP